MPRQTIAPSPPRVIVIYTQEAYPQRCSIVFSSSTSLHDRGSHSYSYGPSPKALQMVSTMKVRDLMFLRLNLTPLTFGEQEMFVKIWRQRAFLVFYPWNNSWQLLYRFWSNYVLWRFCLHLDLGVGVTNRRSLLTYERKRTEVKYCSHSGIVVILMSDS